MKAERETADRLDCAFPGRPVRRDIQWAHFWSHARRLFVELDETVLTVSSRPAPSATSISALTKPPRVRPVVAKPIGSAIPLPSNWSEAAPVARPIAFQACAPCRRGAPKRLDSPTEPVEISPRPTASAAALTAQDRS